MADHPMTHHLNCAKLKLKRHEETADPCSCGAEQPRPKDLGRLRPATVPSLTSEFPEALVHEVRTTSSTGGQKGAKQARFDLIPSEALTVLAEHYAIGAAKYGEDHNWRKGFDWSKSYAALNRHLHAFWGGEDLDPETGSPHMAAVAWHAFTLLTFMAEQPQFDDRFKKGTK